MLNCELDVMEYAVTMEDALIEDYLTCSEIEADEENLILYGEEETFYEYTWEEPELF